MNKKEKILISMVGVSLVAILFLVSVFAQRSIPTLASVPYANEYHATTTSSYYGFPTEKTIKNDAGSLGSVVVTTAGTTGAMELYDATTSNSILRGNTATSSLLITSIPNSLAAGTYVFDIAFNNGLLVVIKGTQGTTTITYR